MTKVVVNRRSLFVFAISITVLSSAAFVQAENMTFDLESKTSLPSLRRPMS